MYEKLLRSVGDFGRFQKLNVFLLCLPCINVALHNLSMVFNMEQPDFRCAVPGLENDTYDIQNDQHARLVNASIPRETTGSADFSQCYTYKPVFPTSSPAHNGSRDVFSYYENQDQHLIGFDQNETAKCDRWVFSKEKYDSTVASHLDLGCDFTSIRTHTNLMMLLGLFIGSFICSPIADLFGRKKTLIFWALLQVACGLCFTVLTSVPLLLALRFFISLTCIGLFMCVFVFVTELVGPSQRAFVGMCTMYFWSCGMFLLVFLFYFVRNWRTAQFILTTPGILYASYWWLIPESPRWLISKGRYSEAADVLRRMARMNGKPVPEKMLEVMISGDNDGERKPSQQKVWYLCATPRLTGRFLVLCLVWFAFNVCYYGLTLNVGSLIEGDLYLNFTILSVMELAGYILSQVLIDRVGRKPLFCSCMLLGGMACLATMGPVLADSDAPWINTVLSSVGKMCTTVCFATAFVFTAELIPTFVRNTGIGICSFFGRIGGLVSPFIANTDMGGDVGRAFPLVVFGGVTVIAGFLALLIPETKDTALPETIEDIRNIRNQKTTAKAPIPFSEAEVPLKESSKSLEH
ncbi:organic cation transporter protein [Aplysia californica]|uniref:Organic cation transporter protein n=1 Tax=Aplysia californica TaxID=6500 RepID=A0ABM1A1P1_APLCA|nr:organic cation transporter protein [Aplysia californica]